MTRLQYGRNAQAFLTTALAAGVLTGVAVAGMTHEVPLGSYVGVSTFDRSGNQPSWRQAYAARFPGCLESLPSDAIPSSVVVVRLTGEVERMDLDEAWQRIENGNAADDVWTVGFCMDPA